MFITLSSTCIQKFNIRHAPLCFLSHSVAVAARIGISHIAWRAGYSSRLVWAVFSDPSWSQRLGLCRQLHPLCSKDSPRGWYLANLEASVFSLKSLSLGYKMNPSETAACHSAPVDPFWTFFHLVCRRHLALLRPPNYIIFGIRQLKQIFWTFVRKNKFISFFCSEVLVLPSKFQASCTLLGSEQRFLLTSQRPPTFAFHEPPDGVFPPTRPLLASCCESCIVEFPLLHLAFFRIFLAASVRTFSLPVRFLSSIPSFLDDHFTTQRSDFSSFFGNVFYW